MNEKEEMELKKKMGFDNMNINQKIGFYTYKDVFFGLQRLKTNEDLK